jgi:hypothetical protein
LALPPHVGAEATVLMSSEQVFHETVEDLPWKPATTFYMQALFVRELLLSGDPSAVHDGAHGFYELAFVSLPDRELPTSAVTALMDVLELKKRAWPKLPTEQERLQSCTPDSTYVPAVVRPPVRPSVTRIPSTTLGVCVSKAPPVNSAKGKRSFGPMANR